jgi:hypothetical protein
MKSHREEWEERIDENKRKSLTNSLKTKNNKL